MSESIVCQAANLNSQALAEVHSSDDPKSAVVERVKVRLGVRCVHAPR